MARRRLSLLLVPAMILLDRAWHYALIATLLTLTLALAWPSLGFTHYAVAWYGGWLIVQGLAIGCMVGQLGPSRVLPPWPRGGDDDEVSANGTERYHGPRHQTMTRVYVEAANDSHVKAGVLIAVAAALVLVPAIFGTVGIVRCWRDGFNNVTNLGDYVYGNPDCNASLTDLVRRQPYATTDLMNYFMCQDDSGVTISWLVIAVLLVAADIVVIWAHEAQVVHVLPTKGLLTR